MIHQAMPEKNGHFFEKPIAICTLLWYNNSVERETAGGTSRRGMEEKNEYLRIRQACI